MAIFSQANTTLGLLLAQMITLSALSYCLPASPDIEYWSILSQRGVEGSCIAWLNERDSK